MQSDLSRRLPCVFAACLTFPRKGTEKHPPKFSITSLLVFRPVLSWTDLALFYADSFQSSPLMLFVYFDCVCHLLDNDLQVLWHKSHKTATVFIKMPRSVIGRRAFLNDITYFGFAICHSIQAGKSKCLLFKRIDERAQIFNGDQNLIARL